ncbi:MAG TPA: alanine--tRNA ligase [bacterium]|nr:alanine--tRNA ligase [bacterium]
MTSRDLRKKFLDFFKKRGHKVIPSSSLIPDDQTVLLTTAGMQQFSLYLIGEKNPLKDFGTRHLVSYQKCFRTGDIEEVGDDTHNTFFEMLGNWSIGKDSKTGYFKEGAIKYAIEFFVNELGLEKDRFWITVFKGDEDIPKDEESIKIWKENGILEKRIIEYGKEDNLWGPVGNTGPCGPNSEIHYDRGEEFSCGSSKCGPNCSKCQRYIELWNLVFIEYFKDEKGNYNLLSQKNVDTGIGFERLVTLLNKETSAYETDLFLPIIQEIEKLSKKKYKENERIFRIISDHIRGSVFLIADGILPSNVERGYILRRLLRRIIRYAKLLGMESDFLIPLAKKVIDNYKDIYPEVSLKENDILVVIQKEEEKFGKALEKGLKQLEKLFELNDHKIIYGEELFDLYQSYGFPLELTKELAKEKGFEIDEKGFYEFQKSHQEVSRAGVEKKFGGVGKEANYEATKLHTATHLLHQALREVLGDDVKQMGSDITYKRLRFDFSYSQKLTEDEIKKVEDLINKKIKQDLLIEKKEMSYNEAVKSGALAFFKEKYPEKVTVYSINNFSKEICAGPHINKTSELGLFKIIKQKSSGAGVRRIKAVLK